LKALLESLLVSKFEYQIFASLAAAGALDLLSSKLMAWVLVEIENFQNCKIENQSYQLTQSLSSSTTRYLELVPHPTRSSTMRDQVQTPTLEPQRGLNMSDAGPNCMSSTWSTQRVFFAGTNGHTRLVDLTQTLYDVDVLDDDGASDCDSIASPVKLNMQPIPKHEDDGTMSSEEPGKCDDMEGLSELPQYDCTFITCDSEQGGNLTSDASLSITEDEDIVNYCSKVATCNDVVVTEDGSLETFVVEIEVENNAITGQYLETAPSIPICSPTLLLHMCLIGILWQRSRRSTSVLTLYLLSPQSVI
jgi:hypothetical protein